MFMGENDIALDVLDNVIETHILIAFLIAKILSKRIFLVFGVVQLIYFFSHFG
jgi:hypothetical protein